MPVDLSHSSSSQLMFPENSEEEVEKTSNLNVISEGVTNRKANPKGKPSILDTGTEIDYDTFGDITSSSSEDVIR